MRINKTLSNMGHKKTCYCGHEQNEAHTMFHSGIFDVCSLYNYRVNNGGFNPINNEEVLE